MQVTSITRIDSIEQRIILINLLPEPRRQSLALRIRNEIRIEHLYEPLVCRPRPVSGKVPVLEQNGREVPPLQLAEAAEEDADLVDPRGVCDEDRVVRRVEEDVQAVLDEVFCEGRGAAGERCGGRGGV